MTKKKESIKIEDLSYEEAYAELMEITQSLETQEHTLDDTMKLFERGQELSRYCESLLNHAEIRIKAISGEDFVDIEKEEDGF